MPIQDESVLRKMEAEIQKALQSKNHSGKLREHVRAVKLMADLILDDQQTWTEGEPIPPMPAPSQTEKVQLSNGERLKDEDANGDSIFDF
ncbi:YwdI family protein [Radiobacillus deserti]|uniref:YwdI family protein n=1 Tax=Radiobacillus deserti TaxID=2594883 RepID=A0A516KJX6_9BACI|nr:YwdI family protein [Radiobacillus deserti]QDP41710.1 hypothetical protein FN924_16925 [Radiobacillus deserti]